MKKTTPKGQAPLTKRDISFLKFLDHGSYTSASTIQLPQRDKLRMIIDFFDTVLYLIEAGYQLLRKRKANAGREAIKNLANALTGKFPNVSIDFSKVNILGGTLASPCGAMYQNEGSAKIELQLVEVHAMQQQPGRRADGDDLLSRTTRILVRAEPGNNTCRRFLHHRYTRRIPGQRSACLAGISFSRSPEQF